MNLTKWDMSLCGSSVANMLTNISVIVIECRLSCKGHFVTGSHGIMLCKGNSHGFKYWYLNI